MNVKLAGELSKQLKISAVQIVREEYEMILLNRLFESTIGKKLVFRGGTALRLAYKSPRFSDDLDFTQIKPIKETDFEKWCKETAESNSSLELVETLKKQFTLFALFRIKDPAVQTTISIKFEISTREDKLEMNKDYTLMSLQSEVTPMTVLSQVATLPRIEKEKLTITPPRVRDVFDLWFINQHLNKPYNMDFSKFGSKEVKRELHRLLAVGARRLIEPWLQKK